MPRSSLVYTCEFPLHTQKANQTHCPLQPPHPPTSFHPPLLAFHAVSQPLKFGGSVGNRFSLASVHFPAPPAVDAGIGATPVEGIDGRRGKWTAGSRRLSPDLRQAKNDRICKHPRNWRHIFFYIFRRIIDYWPKVRKFLSHRSRQPAPLVHRIFGQLVAFEAGVSGGWDGLGLGLDTWRSHAATFALRVRG